MYMYTVEKRVQLYISKIAIGNKGTYFCMCVMAQQKLAHLPIFAPHHTPKLSEGLSIHL